MADLDYGTIFSLLTAANKQAEEESPWADVASFTDKFGNEAVDFALSKDKKTGERNYGLGEGLAVALGTGLLSGFTGGFNRRYVNEQNDLARSVLSDALSGKTITRPERLDASVFTPLENAATLLNLQRKADDKAAEAKAVRDLGQAIQTERIKGIVANPRQADRINAAVDALSRPRTVTPTGGETEGVPIATQPLRRVTPASAASDPAERYQQLLDTFEGREALADEQLKYERDLPQKRESTLEGLRKEFAGKKEVQDFVVSDTGMRSLRKAILDNSGASDMEIVKGSVQAIEPGLAVNGGEYAAAANSGDIPRSYLAQIEGALYGTSKLSKEVRAGLFRIAERRWAEHGENFNKARGFYQESATRQELPGDVTYIPEMIPQSPVPAALRIGGLGTSGTSPAPNVPTPEQAREILRQRGVR